MVRPFSEGLDFTLDTFEPLHKLANRSFLYFRISFLEKFFNVLPPVALLIKPWF